MKLGKRKFRYKGGRQVSESRMLTFSIIIGVAIILLLNYYL